jgi:hypothetical protein
MPDNRFRKRRQIRLGHPMAIRGEMSRCYKGWVAGEITSAEMSRAIFALRSIADLDLALGERGYRPPKQPDGIDDLIAQTGNRFLRQALEGMNGR